MKIFIFIKCLLVLLFVFTSCEYEEEQWEILLSEKFYSWSPYNFVSEDIGVYERKLIWFFDEKNIEGFKIDRRKGDGEWVINYAIVPVSQHFYMDTISLSLNQQYHYRLHAFNGDQESRKVYLTIPASVPAVNSFRAIASSESSVFMSWLLDIEGHDGFIIEKKINDGEWTFFATLNPEDRAYSDFGVQLLDSIYQYRIQTFMHDYVSQYKYQSVTEKCGYSFIDYRDGNEYSTVQIGEKCWMKQNLQWLPFINFPKNWSNYKSRYYVYDYNATDPQEAKLTYNYNTYGVLYNWTAALEACPTGWNLPSYADYLALFELYSDAEGGSMKETGYDYWLSPNLGASNISGFTALPGGYFFYNKFEKIQEHGQWWTSTQRYDIYSLGIGLTHYNDKADVIWVAARRNGFSVRCIRNF